jgi:Uma2 family endonuclease
VWEHGYLMMVPDLVAEVVSPGEEVYDLDRKIDEYFRAGVRRVWVINPEQRTVRVLRSLDDMAGLSGQAVLADDEVLPGFRCPLTTLFAIPGGGTAPTSAAPPAGGTPPTAG